VIWLGIVVVVAALAIRLVALVRRRGATGVSPDDVDPNFTLGIVLTGIGISLAAAVGSGMYALMAAGLVLMAVGAHRTQRSHRH
jgi:NhaP-type Na+/H+ or K+/H+ antiporter